MPRLSRAEDFPRAMLQYAQEATTLAQGRQRSDLDTDRMFELSLAHLIQNVGTAAESRHWNRHVWNRRLGSQRDALYKMRNRIVHETDPMNRDELWQTATETLPAIMPQLEEIVAGL